MDGVLLVLLTNTGLAAVLGLVAWLVDRVWGRPAFGHLLFVVALLALVTPPVVGVGSLRQMVGPSPREVGATDSPPVVPRVAQARSGARAPEAASSSSPAPAQLPVGSSRPIVGTDPLPWSDLLLLFWGTGSLGVLLLLTSRLRSIARLVRDAAPLDAESDAELDAIAVEVGLPRAPVALCHRTCLPPTLVPTLRGVRLVLPNDWTIGDSPAIRRALLRHECAHLRRGDPWVRILEALVTVALWWHPLLWWLRAHLRDAEERACDGWVVAGTDAASRRAYCEALLSAARTRPRSPRTALATGAVRHAPHSSRMRAWSRRLENAMNRETPFRTGRFERTLAAIAVLVFLPFGIAQDPTAGLPPDLLTHLERTRFAWSVEDASPQQWAQDLTARVGRPVEIGPLARSSAGESAGISGLCLPRTSARRVLDIVSTLTGLRWNAVDGRVVFDLSTPNTGGDVVVVHLLGAVKHPGPQTLPGQTTLLELLGRAEFEDDADVSVVQLLRPSPPTGEASAPLRLTIDVRSMIETGDTSRNVVLQAGDLLLVGHQHPELPELYLRVGSRLHFVIPEQLVEQPGSEQLALLGESQAVGRDGTIFVPYIGPVYVNGMTQKAVSDVISQLLSGVFATPLPGRIHRFEARFDPPR